MPRTCRHRFDAETTSIIHAPDGLRCYPAGKSRIEGHGVKVEERAALAATRIQFFVDGAGPCAWYRALTPAQALQDAGYHVALDHVVSEAALEWADVVIFQRRSEHGLADVLRHCRGLGKALVYDLDDDLWNIHPENPARVWYGPAVLKNIEEALRLADVTTTTTVHLANRLRALCRKAVVLPNMLPDMAWADYEPVQQDESKVVIGWAGTDTHLPDLRLLCAVVEQVLDKYPHTELAVAGTSHVPFRHERVRILDPVPLPDYPSLLGNFHIGLAPVVDSVFNRGKSDLKVLEYSRLHLPVVASRIDTYSGSIDHGVTGFLARNPKDWLKYLSRLVEDIELRRSIGHRAGDWAATRMMSQNVELWERAYGLLRP